MEDRDWSSSSSSSSASSRYSPSPSSPLYTTAYHHDGPSNSPPPEMETFDSGSVMAMIRRRRSGHFSTPQARIYKKARMRTRNWSELRQQALDQAAAANINPNTNPPNPPNAAAVPAVQPAHPAGQQQHPPNPPNANPDPVPAPVPEIAQTTLAPVPEEVLEQPQPTVETPQTPEPAADLPTMADQPPLPRDHLVLLVPTTPQLTRQAVLPAQEYEFASPMNVDDPSGMS